MEASYWRAATMARMTGGPSSQIRPPVMRAGQSGRSPIRRGSCGHCVACHTTESHLPSAVTLCLVVRLGLHRPHPLVLLGGIRGVDAWHSSQHAWHSSQHAWHSSSGSWLVVPSMLLLAWHQPAGYMVLLTVQGRQGSTASAASLSARRVVPEGF
jgi:hypothetical protein